VSFVILVVKASV